MAGDKPENPFVGIPFPGAPLVLYNGKPWFLPLAGAQSVQKFELNHYPDSGLCCQCAGQGAFKFQQLALYVEAAAVAA
jgi:hypothetical protein